MGVAVLIVGSGPTGLVAALTLAQNGVDIRIIEKLPHFPIGQRGAGIMPRTLEIYRYLGILDDVKNAGLPFLEWLHYEDGKPVKQVPVMPYEESTPIYPENNPFLLGQDAACRILRNHLKKHNVQVELSTELLSLEQGIDTVTATVAKEGSEETILAKYVVGADGAKGIVRKLLNLTFLGETRDTVHMIIGDTAVTGIDDQHWHRFGDTPTDALMLRPTDRTATENIYFTMLYGAGLDYQRALQDHDYLRAFAYGIAKTPALNIIGVKTIADHRPNMRVVNTFQQGRVFVAGDAAHVQPATGGQGMNSAVMDAFNLAWKLALSAKGLAAPGLLDSYTAERLPVIQQMQRITTALLNKAFGGAGERSPWHRPRVLTQLGVHYRWSPIVVDARGRAGVELDAYGAVGADRLCAGDRAHDAPGLVDVATGSITRLFDVFGPTRHTVLVFADGADPALVGKAVARLPVRVVAIYPKSSIAGVVSAVDLTLRDEEGHAYAAYGAASGSAKIAIVRPDGVVGALVGSTEGVERYLKGVFAI